MRAHRSRRWLCVSSLVLLVACSDGGPLPWHPIPDLRLGREGASRHDVLAGEGPSTDAGTALTLDSPLDGAVLVVGRAVEFRGSTTCAAATLEFVADGKYTFGTLVNVTGLFSFSYTINTPGKGRQIEVRASGAAGCSGSVNRTITLQPARGHTLETLQDDNGCSFELHSVAVPLADPTLDVASVGDAAARTVAQFAAAYASDGAVGALNTGYFDFSFGPVSYARGHFGYESPSGNVKGPRACLVYDQKKRQARVVLSMGGSGSFPDDSDVVCAGPQLVEKGTNVAAAHILSENFDAASGVTTSSPYPRSAACVRDDGSLLLLVAQSASVKACGFDLPELADALVARGCVEALNFDGGGSAGLWYAGPPLVYAPGTEDRAVYQALVVLRP